MKKPAYFLIGSSIIHHFSKITFAPHVQPPA